MTSVGHQEILKKRIERSEEEESSEEENSESEQESQSEPESESESESEEEEEDSDKDGDACVGRNTNEDKIQQVADCDALSGGGLDEKEEEVAIKFPPPSTKLIEVGDLVYCQYGNDIFKSKVLKIETRPLRRNEAPCKAYFVHYQGWSKKFDSWVEQQYVYDYTDENTAMKKQIIQAAKDLKKREMERLSEQETIYSNLVLANGNFKKGKKRKLTRINRVKPPKPLMSKEVLKARSFNRKVRFNSRKEMDLTEYVESFKLNLSLALKKRAVHDWELIALDKRLMIIPRKPSVRTILNDYLKLKGNQLDKISGKSSIMNTTTKNGNNASNNTDNDGNRTTTAGKASKTESVYNGNIEDNDPMQVYRELVSGIEQLFNRALGKCLLYRLERKQYDDYMLKNPESFPIDIYGVEHLLRLFIKLPMLLSMCNDMNGDQNSSKKIQAYLQGFIQFLSNHGNKYFGTVYEQPDEEYMNAFSKQPVMAASDITAGAVATGNGDSNELNPSHGNVESGSSKNSISNLRHKKEEEMKLMDKLLSAPPKKKIKKKY